MPRMLLIALLLILPSACTSIDARMAPDGAAELHVTRFWSDVSGQVEAPDGFKATYASNADSAAINAKLDALVQLLLHAANPAAGP